MGQAVKLAPELKQKILAFPEYRMGAHRVALVLRDGARIQDVLVAWGDEVVKVGGREDFGELPIGDVIDVVNESGLEET